VHYCPRKVLDLESDDALMAFLEIHKNQTQKRVTLQTVIPNARPIASDLEPRFGGNKQNWLKKARFQLALRKGSAWLE
jgi:hypothetical protein